MKKIGWIGTGVMGNAMVQHLIRAGYEVGVYNRTKSKTRNLVDQGATYYDSIAKVTRAGDIIITIVGDPACVAETYFGTNGIIENIKEGSIIIDMTTTKPSLAEEIFEASKNKGAMSLDAPVSGGDVGALEGKLSIMVGGDRKVYDEIYPLFELMGKTIEYCGAAGAGQHTKMANQIGIAGNTIALCEALIYAERSGLDLETTIRVVGGGAAGNWGWNNLAPRIIKSDLDTCFFIKHFVKDMRIALEECQKMNIALPGLALVHSLYTSMIAHGEENLGTQALIKCLKRINNLELDSLIN